MPVTSGDFPELEYEFDCTLAALPQGDIIGKRTCTSVYVESWPHAEQQLIIEYMPHNRDGSVNYKTMVYDHPYPGMLIPFVEPMDCVFRTRVAMPLLVSWRVRLILLSDESMPYPVRQDPGEMQWTPICKGQSIPNGAVSTFVGVYWPTRSGMLRYRILWTTTPTSPQFSISSWCRGTGTQYLVTFGAQLITSQNHEGLFTYVNSQKTVFNPYLTKDIPYNIYIDHDTVAGSRSVSLDLSTIHGGAATR